MPPISGHRESIDVAHGGSGVAIKALKSVARARSAQEAAQKNSSSESFLLCARACQRAHRRENGLDIISPVNSNDNITIERANGRRDVAFALILYEM